MNTSDFLSGVEDIAARKPSYRLGHSGLDGYCDCIGLVIGALKLKGIQWPGVHGSNWAARSAVTGLQPFSLSALQPGDLVFKAREKGSAGWSLPPRYANDPDQKDYYHVGIVTSVKPLTITHMTTPGITRDTRQGKWSHAATLKTLAKEENPPMTTATVISPDGNPVKVRTAPDTDKPWKIRLNPGSTVTVTGKGPKWCAVSIDGLQGYMMTSFLRFEEDEANGEEDTVTLTLPAALVRQLREALNARTDL